MKTFSGKVEIAPCRDCGPVQDRIHILKQVIQATAQGHMMLAGLYETLAKDLPKESEDLRKAAAHQRFLQVESLKATLPDAFEDEGDELPLTP